MSPYLWHPLAPLEVVTMDGVRYWPNFGAGAPGADYHGQPDTRNNVERVAIPREAVENATRARAQRWAAANAGAGNAGAAANAGFGQEGPVVHVAVSLGLG